MTRLPDPAEQWTPTLSGKKFNALAPQVDAIEIQDIATVLSRTFRFRCHSPAVYSVAQHSIAVASRVEHIWALLHDAAETWLPDVQRPYKSLMFFWIPCNGGYTALPFEDAERGVLFAVARRFNLPWPIPEDLWTRIAIADDRCLATECRDLFGEDHPGLESVKAEPYPETIIPGSPTRIAELFLERFEELRGAAG